MLAFARTAACGLVAGAVGTLVMDLVWFGRYKRAGGTGHFFNWEFAVGLDSWDAASAPAKVGRLLYETATRQDLPATRAALTTNIMHWAYGSQWGVVFATAIGASRYVRPWHGPLLGALVWLASYAVLPIAGFYKPIWSYDPKTLWQDLSAHLAYGSATVAAYWIIDRYSPDADPVAPHRPA
jgi:hypothetical protein